MCASCLSHTLQCVPTAEEMAALKTHSTAKRPESEIAPADLLLMGASGSSPHTHAHRIRGLASHLYGVQYMHAWLFWRRVPAAIGSVPDIESRMNCYSHLFSVPDKLKSATEVSYGMINP